MAKSSSTKLRDFAKTTISKITSWLKLWVQITNISENLPSKSSFHCLKKFPGLQRIMMGTLRNFGLKKFLVLKKDEDEVSAEATKRANKVLLSIDYCKILNSWTNCNPGPCSIHMTQTRTIESINKNG